MLSPVQRAVGAQKRFLSQFLCSRPVSYHVINKDVYRFSIPMENRSKRLRVAAGCANRFFRCGLTAVWLYGAQHMHVRESQPFLADFELEAEWRKPRARNPS